MQAVGLDRGEPVSLTWEDSSFQDGWKYGPDRTGETVHVQSLGFVVDSTDACLTLTAAMDGSKGVLCPISIPWAAIIDFDRVSL